MKVGILALQGAVEPHFPILQKLSVEPVSVKQANDLVDIAGIILPGGESTAMLHLLHLHDLWSSLDAFISTRPTWGICAGAILLATKVRSPEQESFGKVPLEIIRNAYGRQVDSFAKSLEPTEHWQGEGPEGVFIRAPVVSEVSSDVKILLKEKDHPVLLEYRHYLVSTFYPELTADLRIHEYFLEKCKNG